MLRRFFSYYTPYKGLFYLDFGWAAGTELPDGGKAVH